jgi:hypothetical protein
MLVFMRRSPAPGAVLVLVALATSLGCGKSRATAGKAEGAEPGPSGAAGQSAGVDCGHAACGTNFVVDAMPTLGCRSGEPCQVNVKLLALGDYHINDDYPYRFLADQKPLVQFSGTDPGGQTVFSKTAGDWQKTDAKTGTMAVHLFVSTPGSYTISGTFKLSVCSAANCVLDQRPVSATFMAD